MQEQGGSSSDWGRTVLEEALDRTRNGIQDPDWEKRARRIREEQKEEQERLEERRIREEERQRRAEEKRRWDEYHKQKGQQRRLEEQDRRMAEQNRMEEVLRKRDEELNKKDEELRKKAAELGRKEEEQRKRTEGQRRNVNEDAEHEAQYRRGVDNLRTADQISAIVRKEKGDLVSKVRHSLPSSTPIPSTSPPSYSQPARASTGPSQRTPERITLSPTLPTPELSPRNIAKFPANLGNPFRKGTGETVELEKKPNDPTFIIPGGGRKFIGKSN